jgi:hypothetical protein
MLTPGTTSGRIAWVRTSDHRGEVGHPALVAGHLADN